MRGTDTETGAFSAFEECFPSPPPFDEVKSWNSTHRRGRRFRGIIRRSQQRFVCKVEAQEELTDDLASTGREVHESREYSLVDWDEEFADGQEVYFLAFPNPALSERQNTSRIVQILRPPVASPPSVCSSLPDCYPPGLSYWPDQSVPLKPLSPPMTRLAHMAAVADQFSAVQHREVSAFKHLVQWSTDAMAEETVSPSLRNNDRIQAVVGTTKIAEPWVIDIDELLGGVEQGSLGHGQDGMKKSPLACHAPPYSSSYMAYSTCGIAFIGMGTPWACPASQYAA
jgi:hypothetical protein